MSACAQAISCSVVEGFEGAFATDGVAEEDRQKVDHLVVPKAPPCKTDALIDGSKDCKRYHDRGPYATRKVSHFPPESAMLERKNQASGGKERCIQCHFEMKFEPGF